MKTRELTGLALDWAVATITKPGIHGVDSLGKLRCVGDYASVYSPSTDWSQGGPIIEREKIATRENGDSDEWYACKRWDYYGKFGPTLLIAAMRCYVASKLGDNVELPEGLN